MTNEFHAFDPDAKPIDTREIHERNGYKQGYQAGLEAAAKRLEEWKRTEETKTEHMWGSIDQAFQNSMNALERVLPVDAADHAVRIIKALLEEKP